MKSKLKIKTTMTRQPLKHKCNKCGKPQPIDKEKSTKQWNVYPTGLKCQCGGEYKMFFKGEEV